jgi:hypothetical protein
VLREFSVGSKSILEFHPGTPFARFVSWLRGQQARQNRVEPTCCPCKVRNPVHCEWQ